MKRIVVPWLAIALLAANAGAQAVPTSGALKEVLKGTIVDWTKGQQAELRLETDGGTFSQGKIDADGNFSLPLPGLEPVRRILFPVGDNFTHNPCPHQGTATPPEVLSNHFSLNVYQNGQKTGDIQLISTAQARPVPPGNHVANPFFHEAPTAMKGTVTCEALIEIYDVRFPAGWNLTVIELHGLNAAGREVRKIVGGPLPRTLAWRLYREFGGIGFEFEPRGEFRGRGFTVQSLTPGLPAQKAGLREKDEIVEVNGRNVLQLTDLAMTQLLQGKPGTTITLGVKRPGANGIVLIKADRVLIRIP